MDKEITILIVEDEMPMQRLLTIALNAAGYRVIVADTGKAAMAMVASHLPCMVILDLGLPDMDGMDVLKQLSEWYDKPILILSIRNAEDDIVKALDKGAADYLTKPFRTGELLARIRLAFRQELCKHEENQKLEFGNLTIDVVGHIVKKNGIQIKLTCTEFAMLVLFMQNRGRVLTHQHILNKIWGHTFMEQSQYLRVYVAQLRKKIEDDPSKPTLLTTEARIGYRFGE